LNINPTPPSTHKKIYFSILPTETKNSKTFKVVPLGIRKSHNMPVSVARKVYSGNPFASPPKQEALRARGANG
jgi:hypothetical protein